MLLNLFNDLIIFFSGKVSVIYVLLSTLNFFVFTKYIKLPSDNLRSFNIGVVNIEFELQMVSSMNIVQSHISAEKTTE